MLRLITDEDLRASIVQGVMFKLPHLDLIRAEDVGLRHTPDPVILEWAAADGRLIVTHDVNTMPRHAYERVRAGMRMPGVIIVPQGLPIGAAVDDLVAIAEYSRDDEWEGQVIYLPL